MSHLHKVARLKPSELAIIAYAVFVVGVVRLRLWFSRSARTPWQRPVLRVLPATRAGHSPARMAWAVRNVSRLIPGASCLTQAMALHHLLARAGHASVVRIGVAVDEARKFRAHAWLEHEGAVIIGGSAERYAELLEWSAAQ